MKRTKAKTGDAVVWVCAGLTVTYLAIHLGMLFDSFVLWGGILEALLLGE